MQGELQLHDLPKAVDVLMLIRHGEKNEIILQRRPWGATKNIAVNAMGMTLSFQLP